MKKTIVKTRRPRYDLKKEVGSKTTTDSINIKDNNSINKGNQKKRDVSINRYFVGKVSSEDIAKHQDKFEIRQLTAKELRDEVCREGYAFAPIFKGSGSKRNFKAASFVAIDIDDGMTLKEALEDEFIKNTASFIYTTVNHGKDGQDHFIIVWELEEPISMLKAIEVLQIALIKRFKRDVSCRKGSKFFFGNPEETCKSHEFYNILSKEITGELIMEELEKERNRLWVDLLQKIEVSKTSMARGNKGERK